MDAQASRIAELERALRPFAALARHLTVFPSDLDDSDPTIEVEISRRDIKRAEAALQRKE